MTKRRHISARPGFNGAVYPQPDRIIDDSTGRTLLMDAIMREDCEKIELLLASGANPHKTDFAGKSPLHYAAGRGQLETIRLLLEQGASINKRDKTLATPLFEALNSPRPLETLEYLLKEGADANIADCNNAVPLHAFAQKSCSSKEIKRLIRATENPNRPDAKGMTPLHYACQQNDLSAVRTLLQEGCSVFSANNNGDTPLHLATTRIALHGDIAKYLLTTEAAQLVNTVNLNGKTPLHLAVNGSQNELVRQMLLVGADPNLTDSRGFTPLRMAAMQWNGDESMTILLIQNGADVNNKSPICDGTPLLQALDSNNITIVRILLDYNADPNAADQSGTSPLLTAVSRDNAEAVKLLLQAGANTGLKNKKGQAALHLACSYGMLREVTLLLAQKADPNIRDLDGRTPLHTAVNMRYSSLELSRPLLEAGADPLIKDNKGITAYDIAYDRDEQLLMDLFKRKLAEKGISYTPKRPPAPPPWSGGRTYDV